MNHGECTVIGAGARCGPEAGSLLQVRHQSVFSHTHTHPHTRIRLSKSMHSGIDSKGITHMISKAHRLGENSSLYIPLLGEKLYRE